MSTEQSTHEETPNKFKMSMNEFVAALALGTLPDELKRAECKGRHISRVVRRRTCTDCRKIMKAGEQFYDFGSSSGNRNICMDCSYISVVQAMKMIDFTAMQE